MFSRICGLAALAVTALGLLAATIGAGGMRPWLSSQPAPEALLSGNQQDLADAIAKGVEDALGGIDAKLGARIAASEKRLEERLRHSEARLEGRLEAKLEEVESRIEKKTEAKVQAWLEVKVDKRIDAKLAAMPSKAGGSPRPAPTTLRPQPQTTTAQVTRTPAPTPKPVGEPQLPELPPATTVCKGSSVPAPKEWCNVEGSRSCIGKWETKYIQDNYEKLKRGFEILRTPGCYQHGQSVATLGYFRTGSTLLYNTVRLWIALAVGDALVAGWSCRDPQPLGIGVQGAVQEQCSMACKDHYWHEGVAERSTVVLMSRRDPFYSVCSRKLMDVWCQPVRDENQKFSWDWVNAYRKKCKESPEMEGEEAVKQCQELMGMQASIYQVRRTHGVDIAYDVLMEDYVRDPYTEIRNVARAIGICEEAIEQEAIVKFMFEMGEELKRHPDHEMSTTLMHDVHSEAQREKQCSHLRDYMLADKACGDWMRANASVDANAILRQMEVDPSLVAAWRRKR